MKLLDGALSVLLICVQVFDWPWVLSESVNVRSADFTAFPYLAVDCSRNVQTPNNDTLLGCGLECSRREDSFGMSLTSNGNGPGVCKLCLYGDGWSGFGQLSNASSSFSSSSSSVGDSHTSTWIKQSNWSITPDVNEEYLLPDGLRTGSVVRIVGFPTGNVSFSVRLKYDVTNVEIPLNVIVYFNDSGYTNSIVIKRKVNSSWRVHHVLDSYFPFEVNRPFEIVMLMSPSTYTVYINGLYIYDLDRFLTMPEQIRYFQFRRQADITVDFY